MFCYVALCGPREGDIRSVRETCRSVWMRMGVLGCCWGCSCRIGTAESAVAESAPRRRCAESATERPKFVGASDSEFLVLDHYQLVAEVNPFPIPGRPSVRPSEPSMLAAAVGTAPGTARTKKKCPGIVKVIKMGVISGLESQNNAPSAGFINVCLW